MSPKQAAYLQALRELYPVAHAAATKARPDSASLRIGHVERTIKNRWGAKRFPSKQTAAREALLLHAGNLSRAEVSLEPYVGVNRTLTFKSRDSYGNFTARPMDEQREELRELLERERPAVLAYMRRTGEAVEAVEAVEAAPEPFDWKDSGGFWLSPTDFLARHQDNRAECERRAAIAEPLDEVSMRPALAARALYQAGAPWAGSFVLDSYTKT